MADYQQIADAGSMPAVRSASYATIPSNTVYDQNALHSNQDMPFSEEALIKAFRLAQEDDYNHLLITTHRVIFETKRHSNSNSYLLSNYSFNACILALLQLLLSVLRFTVWLFTMGTEPDSLIRDTNFLLKDITEIRLMRVRCSELANHATVLYYISFFSVLFICLAPIWPLGAVIFVFVDILSLCSMIFIGYRIAGNLAEVFSSRTKQLLFGVLAACFVLFVVYWSCALSYLFGAHVVGKLVAAGVFGWLCVICCGFFMRLVVNDKTVKGLITITGRKSSVVLALQWEDAVAAKNLIWSLRKDVSVIE